MSTVQAAQKAAHAAPITSQASKMVMAMREKDMLLEARSMTCDQAPSAGSPASLAQF